MKGSFARGEEGVNGLLSDALLSICIQILTPRYQAGPSATTGLLQPYGGCYLLLHRCPPGSAAASDNVGASAGQLVDTAGRVSSERMNEWKK